MTEERKKLIHEGLRALIEEKLENLEESIGNKDHMNREVDSYLDVYRVAKKELSNAEEYMTRFYSITSKFWEIKNEKNIFNTLEVKQAAKKAEEILS